MQGGQVVPTVSGVVVAQQPGAVAGDIQAKVHGLVRNRLQIVTSADAEAYMRSLTPDQKATDKFLGYHSCKPKSACCKGFCPCASMCGAQNVKCNDNCVWMIPCPFFCFFCCCSCEREANYGSWVTRDKHGAKTGEIMLIDHERGTMAFYSVACCTSKSGSGGCCSCDPALQSEPDYYCVKSGATDM
eukprot:g3249.t1